MSDSRSSSTSGETGADSSSRRSRGLTTMSKWKRKSIHLTADDFDDLDRPKGERGTGFRHYIGVVARSKVPINYTDWRKVEAGLKNTIWEDIKTTCNLKDDYLKKKIIQQAGYRMRNFKSKLVRKWIRDKDKRKDTPMDVYNFITAEDWEQFKERVMSEEFEATSEKARESQSRNKYPHHMGSAGYAGMREVWAQDDPLGHLSSSGSVSDSILHSDRSWDYLRARVHVHPDGSLIYPHGIMEVYDKIVDKSKEVEDGTFVPSRHHDILSAALGKEDHPGRPRTFGGYAGGVRAVFGKRSEKSKNYNFDREDLDNRVAREVQSQLNAEFDSRVQQRVVDTLIQLGIQVPAGMGSMINTRPASNSSVCHASVPPDPFMAITEITDCILSIPWEGQMQQVAQGTCYPITVDMVVHGCQLVEGNVKVRIDMVPEQYRQLPLPFAVRDDLVVLGDAMGSFVQWPKPCVQLVNDPPVLKNKKRAGRQEKPQSFAASATAQRNLVDEATYRGLPGSCKLLVDLINMMPTGNDTLEVPIDDLFPGSSESEIFVTATDIAEFMAMKSLSAPILAVFQLHIHQNCQMYEIPIGFMNPSVIAAVMIRTQHTEASRYINDALCNLSDKKYILAPYNQDHHWLLLVIEPSTNTVYVMDSLANHKRNLVIKSLISVAFRVMWDKIGVRRSSVQWKLLPCTQQPGAEECGYCVMKNMNDVMIRCGQGDDLQTVYGAEEYSQANIDVVRESWVEFFREVMK